MLYRRGFILLVVLGLLGIFAILSVSFVRFTGQNKSLSQGYVDKVRSNALTMAGYEYAAKKMLNTVTHDVTWETFSLGSGTYIEGGDVVNLKTFDASGQININDGIRAGQVEVSFEQSGGPNPAFDQYHADALDPYPNSYILDPIRLYTEEERYPGDDDDDDDDDDDEDEGGDENFAGPGGPGQFGGGPGEGGDGGGLGDKTNEENYNEARSGLINLRLRRILNAYGDVHRYIDKVYDGDYSNIELSAYDRGEVTLPEIFFSIREKYSSDGERGKTMTSSPAHNTEIDDPKKYNNGLGDRIIERRPQGGFTYLDEIKDIVNSWASDPGIELSDSYLNGQTFYDLITYDLTIASYEDNFYRIDDEMRFGDITKSTGSFFIPKDLQLDPPNLKDMWVPHSVPLINMNAASFFVRSAVFYAPTNVSFPCDGASTLTPYGGDLNYFGEHTAMEALAAAPSIGVLPAAFDYFDPDDGPYGKQISLAAREHGRDREYERNVGRKNHLMSLRDAMGLSFAWELYGDRKWGEGLEEENSGDDGGGPPPPMMWRGGLGSPHAGKKSESVHNFDEFRNFLYQWSIGGLWDLDTKGTFPGYEKAKPPITTNMGLPDSGYGFKDGDFEQPLNKGVNFNARIFHSSPANMMGVFVNDYVHRTLPHIFSCQRRIPSYFGGVPSALQSPYVMVRQGVEEGEINYESFFDEDKGINYYCTLPFRKIEDFVWRFIHPKVCFLPGGVYRFSVIGKIQSTNGVTISQSSLNAVAKVFDVKRFRSQKQFDQITDWENTHQEILIGPEFKITGNSQYPNHYLGFVGLKDFEEDLLWNADVKKRDIYMAGKRPTLSGDNGESFFPQFVMNFNPEDNKELKNNSTYGTAPVPMDSDSDPWLERLGSRANGYDESLMEGAESPLFGDFKTQQLSDLSPFGGLRFMSMNHGPFAQKEGEESHGSFNDSLYWRLDDLLTSGDRMVGRDLSAGVMTFWFQIPSMYDYPVDSVVEPGHVIRPRSFSRTLVCLNLWEYYGHNDTAAPPLNRFLRPVSLTIGIKRTDKKVDDKNLQGLCVFARYDSGSESFSSNDPRPTNILGPGHNNFIPPGGVDYLTLAKYEELVPNTDYNTLNFMSDLQPTQDYSAYRAIAHRSCEVSASFKNSRSNGPGSWHRVCVYWNFYLDDSVEPRKQIYIDLHDATNKAFAESHYFQTAVIPASYVFGQDFDYHGIPDDENNRNYGFMHPFDSTMVLSLGESHMRRLYRYTLIDPSVIDGNRVRLTTTMNYEPSWRLDSCIDNFRLYLGPNPQNDDAIRENGPPDLAYFDADEYENFFKHSAYGAMRYKVMNKYHHVSYTDETVEPLWVINPDIPEGSKLLHLGARVYYPPGNDVPGDDKSFSMDENTPYVLLTAGNSTQVSEAHGGYLDVTTNEQDYLYSDFQVGQDFRVFMQYKAHKPWLNGNPKQRMNPAREDPDFENGEGLVYTGYVTKNVFDQDEFKGDHMTEIGWIKQVSFRYATPGGTELINWSLD